MSVNDFLDNCLLLDLETDGTRLYHIGAVYSRQVFERKGRFDSQTALKELDQFASSAVYVLGHNLLGHDLPFFESLAPNLSLLHKPVVDTLYLSPLAFPENPYHRLVKDYKLVRDSLNDPVADARLAASVLCDQWDSFITLSKNESEVLDFYRYCFEESANSFLRSNGLKDVFTALGASPISENDAFAIFQKHMQDKTCETAVTMVAFKYLLDPVKRPTLAYCLAWLRVAGHNSVLPPWVRHRFHDVVPILREMRDVPCSSPSCVWCRTTMSESGSCNTETASDRYVGICSGVHCCTLGTETLQASGHPQELLHIVAHHHTWQGVDSGSCPAVTGFDSSSRCTSNNRDTVKILQAYVTEWTRERVW